MERIEQLSPKTVLNLIHSFTLDSIRSDRLFDRVYEKFDLSPEAFDLADLCMLSQKSLIYFEDRHLRTVLKNKRDEIFQPTFEDRETELQRLVDMNTAIYARAATLRESMNLLDIKAMFGSLAKFCDIVGECAGLSPKEVLDKYPAIPNLIGALMDSFLELKETFDISDIAEFVNCLHLVAEVQSEQSVNFGRELKYRLKKALEKHKPRGLVDEMRRSVKKIEEQHSLRKTFLKVLG